MTLKVYHNPVLFQNTRDLKVKSFNINKSVHYRFKTSQKKAKNLIHNLCWNLENNKFISVDITNKAIVKASFVL